MRRRLITSRRLRATLRSSAAARPWCTPIRAVDHAGRVYLIERHVTSQAELAALVHAYVEHSQQAVPPLWPRRQLDEIAAVA